MPSLSTPKLTKPSFSRPKLARPKLAAPKLARPTLNLSLGRRSGASLVGLDIQPGHVTAVQAHVNGALVAEQAAALPLPADTMREGEVLDAQALSETLRELFAGSGLSKRVRIGIANQRTVLRTLELPPVTDRKELAAAVRFEAQEQVPMPLANAVLDFQSLGVHDTPAGQRQQVVLVAAQLDMVRALLTAVRQAGLRPEGVDLSAFALIRSLYRHDAQHDGRVLYLNVDGLTNMAIAEGPVCRFTRVVGGGLEAMAGELAERRGVAVAEARAAIACADLTPPVAVAPEPPAMPPEPMPVEPGLVEPGLGESAFGPASGEPVFGPSSGESVFESAPGESERYALAQDPAPADLAPAEPAPMDDVSFVLHNGIREIAGEVRNSLEFHRSQDAGGEVTLVVLSGAALDVPGFAEALEAELGVPLTRATVAMADGASADTGLSSQRLAIATGLAVEEVSR